jgi:hypothetical protein
VWQFFKQPEKTELCPSKRDIFKYSFYTYINCPYSHFIKDLSPFLQRIAVKFFCKMPTRIKNAK